MSSGTYTGISRSAFSTEIPLCRYSNSRARSRKQAWTGTLESVFPTNRVQTAKTVVEQRLYKTSDIYVCNNKVAKPTVFIPVFPGTNCEYDSRVRLREPERM